MPNPKNSPAPRRVLERVRTRFNEVEVRESGGLVSFEIAGAAHAEWHPHRRVTRQAWDALAAAALLHPATDAPDLLMLGLGGGTGARILRTLLPRARITAVEIDGGMIALGRRHMRLDDLGLEILEADAFRFLRDTRRRFDVVIDDIYLSGAEDAVRPARMDDRMIRSLRRVLKPDGVAAINLITGRGHRAVQSAARAAMRRAFAQVVSIRPPDSLNETLAGARRLLPAAVLRRAAGRFDHYRDQADWRALSARRLPR